MRVRLAILLAGIGLLLGAALLNGHLVGFSSADEAKVAKVEKPAVLDPTLQRSFGKQATVIVFLGTGCPVSNAYIPHLNEWAKKYEPQGVRFIGINANSQDSAADVAKHAKEYSITFPVIKDDGQRIAAALEAERVPEAVLLDSQQKIRYRGRIDDRYGVTSRKNKASREDLAMALDELLAGKPVSVARTEVSGCLIGRDPQATKLPVTYSNQVARIVQSKCQACHRSDGAAPFALANYDQAKSWAATIKEVVVQRRMPPWHADPHFGKFANDRSLSQAEIDTLIAWIDGGTAKGDDKDLPAPIAYPKGKWQIGEPDLILSMPKEFNVPAKGVLPYQDFIVETNFKEDRWIERAQVLPGSKTVHHVVVFLQGADNTWLCTYVPGESPLILPPGTAKKIPAGAKLRFNMHYTPLGKAETDRTALGLIFAKQPPQKEIRHLVLDKHDILIPANAGNHKEEKEFTIPANTTVLSLFPHMHVRGKSWECRVRYADGRTETVLKVPRYDFNWQHTYRFAEPLLLPAGAKLVCVAHYDNSKDNPANPNPAQAAKWGPQTWDEMFVCGVEYQVDNRGDARAPADPLAPTGRFPREQAGQAAKFLLAAGSKLTDLPLQPELDPAQATGLKLGALVLPAQKLTLEVLDKSGREVVPVGQLWLQDWTLQVNGKAPAPESVRRVPVTLGNRQTQLTLYLLGVRKNAGGALDLVIYAQGKEPALTLPLQEVAIQQDVPIEIGTTRGDGATNGITLNLLGKYQAVLALAAKDR